MDLGMTYDVPLIFGILTCDTLEQAQARVDDNYAIYALNYLAQRSHASKLLEKRHSEISL
jgi:6,7-dimethyl-8-ribityllumazine synthase